MAVSSFFHPDNVRARQEKSAAADLARACSPLPECLAQEVAHAWKVKKVNEGLGAANRFAFTYADQFKSLSFGVDLTAGDDALQTTARLRVGEIMRAQRLASVIPFGSLKPVSNENALDYAKRVYRAVPDAEHETGALLRLSDEAFWLRNMRKVQARTIEHELIKFNRVARNKGAYVSGESLAKHRAAKRRNRAMLENTVAVNDLGQSFTLAELSDKSVSNLEIRGAELMTRIVGLETIAQELDMAGVFLTMTCPSRFHAQKQNSRGDCWPNPKYDPDLSPRVAQSYLCRVWAQLRAALNRRGIHPFGVRVAEPHHDATPHWHVLLFVDPKQRGALVRLARKYFREADKHEPMAWKHRFTVKHIDWSRGSAAGYIIKYICKNLDGHGVDDGDFDSGLDAASGAERVQAWASLWGIRQFQFIGAAPVGVWRELRRLRDDVPDEFLAAAMAADEGDWAEFSLLMKLDKKRLLVVDAGMNKYQEAVTVVRGLVDVASGAQVVTRIRDWVISRKGVAFDLPRTGVNNCTVEKILLPQGDKWAGPVIEKRPLPLWMAKDFEKANRFEGK